MSQEFDHDVTLKQALPVENSMERRAVALRFAIETKGVAFSLKNDGSIQESAEQVLAAARIYQAYIEGDL
jgi:hypothetical protein